MNSFTLIILLLLILAIANNFIMYNKCYNNTSANLNTSSVSQEIKSENK